LQRCKFQFRQTKSVTNPTVAKNGSSYLIHAVWLTLALRRVDSAITVLVGAVLSILRGRGQVVDHVPCYRLGWHYHRSKSIFEPAISEK